MAVKVTNHRKDGTIISDEELKNIVLKEKDFPLLYATIRRMNERLAREEMEKREKEGMCLT